MGVELPLPGTSTFYFTFSVDENSTGGLAVAELPFPAGPRQEAHCFSADTSCPQAGVTVNDVKHIAAASPWNTKPVNIQERMAGLVFWQGFEVILRHFIIGAPKI